MGLGKRSLLAGLFFMLTVSAFGQGVYEAWVARYDGPVSSYDYGRALAIDKNGNLCVTGTHTDTLGGYENSDYVTIKYAPNGNILWLKSYDADNYYDWPDALAVDDSGNVYVTGNSGGSCATIKYTPDGDTVWVRRYSGFPLALTVDDSSNVYVTGGTEYVEDYLTIKYGPNGDTLWTRRYNGPYSGQDWATDVAVDKGGNVYVTGYAGGTTFEIATIKYAPNGDTLWSRQYPGSYLAYGIPRRLAVDDSGNVYVTGYSGSAPISLDCVVIKYTPNGDTLWVRTYNGPLNYEDYPKAVALDNNGNLYLCGSTTGDSGGYLNIDYLIMKYAPNGDTLWVRSYNYGPGYSGDLAWALAVDDSGNVFVTGSSLDTLGNEDIATVKYSPQGDLLWEMRYDGPINGADEAAALAVDDSGNVYVTGVSEGDGTSMDIVTIKYSPCSDIPGDVNSSGTITLGDIVHLLNYLFDRDYPPCIGIDPGNCWDYGLVCRGDVNNSASITLGDIVHLLNYLFDRDNPPCVGTDPGNCWTPVANGACCQPVPSLKAN